VFEQGRLLQSSSPENRTYTTKSNSLAHAERKSGDSQGITQPDLPAARESLNLHLRAQISVWAPAITHAKTEQGNTHNGQRRVVPAFNHFGSSLCLCPV